MSLAVDSHVIGVSREHEVAPLREDGARTGRGGGSGGGGGGGGGSVEMMGVVLRLCAEDEASAIFAFSSPFWYPVPDPDMASMPLSVSLT